MKFKIFIAMVMASPVAFSALPAKDKISPQSYSLKPTPREQALYEQLAGSSKTPVAPTSNKITASAAKALTLARQSRSEKNYILAIKRYNFILKYYSKTSQAKTALSDKASLYKEMGLTEQAAYNQKKVSTFSAATSGSSSSSRMNPKPVIKR